MDHYRIAAELEAPPFFRAFAAVDNRSSKPVELKLYWDEHPLDAKTLDYFLKSLQPAIGLKHGNVQRVIEVVPVAGRVYVVTEPVTGTILSRCSDGFRARFDAATLIIAKGQANYETLSDEGPRLFFLLKVKCPVIGRFAGAPAGSIILQQGRPAPESAKG